MVLARMPPYHPALMLKVLLYGYATGVTSSRKLEARLAADVGFMYLAGQSHPDHKTISSFRRRHLGAFGALFLHVLVLCHEAGLARSAGSRSMGRRSRPTPRGTRP